ncbi:MAG: hypothetical protein M3Y74_13985, partial [Chloroflexota bacterium]|nr:hypothetical protein [Chloroflexota bacterium]
LDVALIYRVVRVEDLVFRHELDALARERGVALAYVVGGHTGAEGAYRLSPDHLRELVPDIAEREAYVCGPPAMMRVAETNLRCVGVPRAAIHMERFAL